MKNYSDFNVINSLVIIIIGCIIGKVCHRFVNNTADTSVARNVKILHTLSRTGPRMKMSRPSGCYSERPGS